MMSACPVEFSEMETAALSWDTISQSDPPPPRSSHAMVKISNCQAVLYGGRDNEKQYESMYLGSIVRKQEGHHIIWKEISVLNEVTSKQIQKHHITLHVNPSNINEIFMFGNTSSHSKNDLNSLSASIGFNEKSFSVTKFNITYERLEARASSLTFKDSDEFQPYCRYDQASCIIDNVIYFFGGRNAYSNVYYNDLFCFHMKDSRWKLLIPITDDKACETDNIPSARANATMAVVNNAIYLIGGESVAATTGKKNIHAETFKLDLNTLKWEFEAVNNPKFNFVHGIYNDSIITFGGRTKHSRINSIDIYLTMTKTWLQPELEHSFRGRTSTTCIELSYDDAKYLLVWGGYTGSHKHVNEALLLRVYPTKKKNNGKRKAVSHPYTTDGTEAKIPLLQFSPEPSGIDNDVPRQDFTTVLRYLESVDTRTSQSSFKIQMISEAMTGLVNEVSLVKEKLTIVSEENKALKLLIDPAYSQGNVSFNQVLSHFEDKLGTIYTAIMKDKKYSKQSAHDLEATQSSQDGFRSESNSEPTVESLQQELMLVREKNENLEHSLSIHKTQLSQLRSKARSALEEVLKHQEDFSQSSIHSETSTTSSGS